MTEKPQDWIDNIMTDFRILRKIHKIENGYILEQEVREIIKKHLPQESTYEIDENTSDGYHTFKELYDHRIALFIALIKANPEISYRANNNDDGNGYEGWFVAGIHTPNGDISYHLPNDKRTALDGYGITTTLNAPKRDGHTPADVVNRLLMFEHKESTYESGYQKGRDDMKMEMEEKQSSKIIIEKKTIEDMIQQNRIRKNLGGNDNCYYYFYEGAIESLESLLSLPQSLSPTDTK